MYPIRFKHRITIFFFIFGVSIHTLLLFTYFPCKFWVNMLSKSFYQLRSQLCSQQNLYCLYMCCTFFLMLTPKIKTVFRHSLLICLKIVLAILWKLRTQYTSSVTSNGSQFSKLLSNKLIKPGKIYSKPSDTRYVKMIYIPQRCDTAQSPLRANSEYKVGSHCLANELTWQ